MNSWFPPINRTTLFLPDALGKVFANVVINLNVEYLSNEVIERPMYGMFAVDSIYDALHSIELVNVQRHHEDSICTERKLVRND